MESKLVNAREIGLEATVRSIKELLVERFQVSPSTEAIETDAPIFSAGVGLSSLEGIELLSLIESKYNVRIVDVEQWVEEPPTVRGVAQFLIDNSSTNVPAT